MKAPSFESQVGRVFGRLTVLGVIRHPGQRPKFRCGCKCGAETVKTASDVTTGHTTSCGCSRRDNTGRPAEHGLSHSPTYASWSAMRGRVKGRGHRGYVSVDMDPAWESFAVFLHDMGERPEGTTLDRKDNTKGYWPGNCQWSTPEQQSWNRTVTRWIVCGDETLPAAVACRKFGVSEDSLYRRVRENEESHQQAFNHLLHFKS